ncbi:MAG: M48 family metalloprotease [Planctomycetota bacterium]
MNLLIGFVILICLFASETGNPGPVEQPKVRIALVGLIAFIVPALAILQTIFFTRRLNDPGIPYEKHQLNMRRLSACHSAVWFIASMAIIYALKWHEIIRVNWGLEDWILVDDFFILLPIVGSLVLSWVIFFEIQSALQTANHLKTKRENEFKKRFRFVKIRIQVYLFIVLIPILAGVLFKDALLWVQTLSTVEQLVVGLFIVVLTACLSPMMFRWLWNSESLTSHLRNPLERICRDNHLKIQDIRVWKTGSQIVNALVVGFVPRLRFVLLSDRLIEHFQDNEICAIFRHEMAHLKRYHLPIRSGFILLPIVMLAISEFTGQGWVATKFDSLCDQISIAESGRILIGGSIYLAYLIVTLAWLSRGMEFESDLVSCYSKRDSKFDAVQANDMSDALLRLVSYCPDQLQRRTLFHPSVLERIAVLQRVQQDPQDARRMLTLVQCRRWKGLAILTALIWCICFI